jgi:ABC-type transport system involved in multi-copper enzyme maturation permease subunit
MRNPAQTTFGAVFWAEVLLNSKRVAPYVLMILFAGNALLWWGWGPAVRLGWATNSDYYIARNLQAFSFLLGLPIFNAVIMGDPVIRDFRLGVDPLIFSKPVNRAEYLLGKFFGNFVVLVCCQSAFALTLLMLQAFRTSQMIVQPLRVLPYFKHFFFFVVISHLALAAFYFTVGTLTRNTKIVYGLAVCFYPLYVSYQFLLVKGRTPRWGSLLDPLLLNAGPAGGGFGHTADFLNRYVVGYSSDMIANRALVIAAAAACLLILYVRFTTAERAEDVEKLTRLNLSTAAERVYYDSDIPPGPRGDRIGESDSPEKESLRIIPLSEVARANEGVRANFNKLIAALGVEFRLLRAERSLVVLMPLATFLSTLELAFYNVVPEASYSATYASSTARTLLLFLFGMTVFYTGEAMRRDREVRIEPLLWATPVPNNVLLLSKFLATLSMTVALIVLVGLTAIVIQFLRGHTPIEIPAFLLTYSVILLPGIVFLTAVSVALNVVLRDKYITYAVSVGTGAALFYLYSQGYNHWLYNPLLYQLWRYTDLTGAEGNQATILLHRLYCFAIATACLSLAHIFFERKSTRALKAGARLSSRGWSIVVLIVSVVVTAIAGLLIGVKR